MIVLHKSGFVSQNCIKLATEIKKPVRVAQKSIFLHLFSYRNRNICDMLPPLFQRHPHSLFKGRRRWS